MKERVVVPYSEFRAKLELKEAEKTKLAESRVVIDFVQFLLKRDHDGRGPDVA